MSNASSRLRNWFKRPLGIVFGGIALSLLTMVATVLFLNPPQCPLEYTQQQVDASNCVVGANIGAGLGMILAAGILAASMTLAVVVAYMKLRSGKTAASVKAGGDHGQPAESSDGKRWPHPIWALVISMVIFIASQLLAGVVLSVIAGAAGKPSLQDLFGEGVTLQFTFAFLVYGGMLAAIWLYVSQRGIAARDLGYSRPRWIDPVYAIVALFVYMAAFIVAQSLVSLIIPGVDLEQRQDTGFGDAAGAGVLPLVLTFAALVILAPVAEETMMRGFLFGALRRRLSFVVTALVVSALFASLHLAGGEEGAGLLWVAAIDTFVLSLALCYVREKTGRLWACIGLHMLKNGIAFTALFILGLNG